MRADAKRFAPGSASAPGLPRTKGERGAVDKPVGRNEAGGAGQAEAPAVEAVDRIPLDVDRAAVSAPAPTSLSARLTSIPPMRPRRRDWSISAAAARIAGHRRTDGIDQRSDARLTSPRLLRSGHKAAGSAPAKALCAAIWVSFGVKSATSTSDTSILAASASPIRSSSHARSATQSAGWTPNGVGALARSALRRAI